VHIYSIDGRGDEKAEEECKRGGVRGGRERNAGGEGSEGRRNMFSFFLFSRVRQTDRERESPSRSLPPINPSPPPLTRYYNT
jgi:hypothetical protein